MSSCINSRVFTETKDTLAPIRRAFGLPTILFWRLKLSVGKYLRVCGTRVTPVTRVRSIPPTRECRPHHGTVPEWCLLSSISRASHQPTQARHDYNATDTRGFLLLSPWNTPNVSVVRRQGPEMYVNVMSTTCWMQIPPELLCHLQPHSPYF